MLYETFKADFENNPHEAMSLSELNLLVREAISNALPENYWVRAETSDVRVNASSGHCYLEFIDKDEFSGQIVAKSRGTIWARTYQMLRPYFEQETGQTFRSGLKVLVNVSVTFHELYGYSLRVHNIDPSYTLGDLVKKRREIIRRLQEEGIFELNKELPFPSLPRRIAVITSPTAAGYEDFTDQLLHNKGGFPFYTKLFPAIMQGEKTEESIIDALDRIFPYADIFDVVVIIRGGGSASELSCFDSYLLAANCAQFPLPVVTGIGHERDDTVVDMVAHTRMKTPTAVASFLIECMSREAEQLQDLENRICAEATKRITEERAVIQILATRFPVIVTGLVEKHRNRLHAMTVHLSVLPQWIRHHSENLDEILPRVQRAIDATLSKHKTFIDGMPLRLRSVFDTIISGHRRETELQEQYIKMVSPEYILKRGYTLTVKDGKIVKHAADLSAGDEITVKFADGEKKGKIIK
ncbi:MAG: exodeoxyribonuclease VII large subunit [Tannerella sp.]|jgi:exodeoxyribonuclease VII large subunit|nr:exodeoxyribonuclease VII large subunit [Tannerella sp.]